MNYDIIPGWLLWTLVGAFLLLFIGGALLLRWMRRWPERQYHKRYDRANHPVKEAK